MKQYDTIPYYGDHWGARVLAFDKLDGSNLRFEYSRKRGFYKFGTRNCMIDASHEQFGAAVGVFLEKYADGVAAVMGSKAYRDALSCVCFAEWVGARSAFGQHVPGDSMDAVLFDVSVHKRGLVHPRTFVDDFGHLGVPRVVYDGPLSEHLVTRVKVNEFGLSEGVICKGVVSTRKDRRALYYCKIKTNEWFARLRSADRGAYEAELAQEGERALS